MKRNSPFRSDRGSVLVQVLITAAIAMIVVLVLGEMSVMMNRFVSHSQTKLSLFELRNNILSVVLSDPAWQKTIAHADNTADANKLLCLSGTNGVTPPPIDCSGINEELTLVDGSNVVVVQKGTPTSGFTRQGAPCNSFDATTGNSNCPIHLEVRWQTDCVSPCNQQAPPLKILVSFQYKDPNSTFSINTDSLNFVIRR